MATGDQSGSWGTTTNTNLELIAEAFSFGTEAITTNADTHTTTIADGSTDPGRSIYLKYTGTLDSACTITIGPNTVSKLWFIENGTSGSQNIIISQGSGANVTVPAGEVKAIYSDGAGSGAAMVDAFANLKVSDAAQTNITSLGTLTTLTVDDITIDGSTISDSGDLTLDVGGDIVLDAAGQQIFFTSAGTNVGQIDMAGTDLEIKSLVSNADFFIRGNDDGSEITALTFDMSAAGAATFNAGVDVTGNITTSGDTLSISHTGNTSTISLTQKAGTQNSVATISANREDTSSSASRLIFSTNDGSSTAEKMRIDNVGLVTMTHSASAHTGGLKLINSQAGGFGSALAFQSERSDNNALVDAARIRTEGASSWNSDSTTESNLIFENCNNNSLAEKMRLDNSGNLLVGTTSTSVGAASSGSGFRVDGANGIVQAASSGNTPAILNRTSDDGNIVSLRKDGSEIGSVGVKSGDPYIASVGTFSVGLMFEGSSGARDVRPCDKTGATLDGSVDLGDSTARFNNIHATNATIQTSDRNEKQDEATISDAEKKVAVAAKGLLKKFRFKSAVAEKGSNARIHFGIVAQDLKDAFTAEGLDASDYSMWCSDTWTDDDGNEQTRLGVRYNELLAFIIAAI